MGDTKLVGIARAHIADPQIVNRLARGEEDRIRPCAATVILVLTLLGGVKGLPVRRQRQRSNA